MRETFPAPRPWLAAVVATALLLGMLAQLPHLSDDAWEDEAATLMLFASQDAAHPFKDYSRPNNHMLFSAVLSLWWSPGDDVSSARLVPMASWLLSMLLMITCGRRLLGWPATALGITLWSGAALTAAFAIALRGYGFSWPWTLLVFFAAQRFIVDAQRGAGLLFIAASFICLAILPTNAMVVAVCVVCSVLLAVQMQGTLPRVVLGRALLALPMGLLGALIYLPHRAQLLGHIHRGFSRWASADVLSHWLLASSAPYWPLLPLMVYGAWITVTASPATVSRDSRCAVALAASLLVVVPSAVLLSPTPLMPRALVPLLPLWCLAGGGLLVPVVTRVITLRRWPLMQTLAALALLCFALGRLMPACGGVVWQFPPGDDLCHQFYRHNYRPSLLMRALDQAYAGAPVLLEARDMWSMVFAQKNSGQQKVLLLDSENWRTLFPSRTPRLVVSKSPSAARALAVQVMARQPRKLRQSLDSGVLKLYTVDW
jgi:hypothetical protein